VLLDIDVDFSAHAEFRKVNSRLHRKASARDDPAIVARFEVVHVGAVAVDIFPDGVPRAMHEELTVTVALDDAPRRVNHLLATQRTAFPHGLLDQIHRRVARLLHDFEGFSVLARNFLAHVSHPGDVEIDGAGLLELSPHIQEH